MRSDAEILAIVCRVVSENTVGHPNVSAETKFADLKYLYKPQLGHSEEQSKLIAKRLARKSSIRNLMWPILDEFHEFDRNNPWIFPDYFSYDKTYRRTKTVQDVCKVIKDGYELMAKELAKQTASKNTSSALKKQLKCVALIDLDDLLHGKPTWEEVQKFFMEGEFDDEKYLVQAIKSHLITPEQKKLLFKFDLSIQDILNGRYGGKRGEETAVSEIYSSWNEKLGFHNFGS